MKLLYDNSQLLNKVSQENPWLIKFFNMKYLELFKYYYNNLEPLEKIIVDGKIITLSKKTKSFYYLLLKYEDIKLELIDTARSAYFNGYNSLIGKNSFRTEKSELDTIDV